MVTFKLMWTKLHKYIAKEEKALSCWKKGTLKVDVRFLINTQKQTMQYAGRAMIRHNSKCYLVHKNGLLRLCFGIFSKYLPKIMFRD